MGNFGLSMLCFWSAYLIVTLIGILHTLFNIYVLHMKPKDEDSMGEAYEKTKPWHPLYNLTVFTAFGCLYMANLPCPYVCEAFATSAIWTGLCIVFDLFAWVIIRHPWSLSLREFYIGYQPWISLIYAAIFLGPLLGALFLLNN